MNTEERGNRDPLTGAVIGAFYDVYREVGIGFLESVYSRAVALAVRQRGLSVATEVPLTVKFRGETVGEFRADLVVERRLIVEVKAAEALASSHRAQLLNYLRASPLELGLLVNFGAKFQFERYLMTNDRKRDRTR